jgi:hypothetical protein|tara:strand:+ start:14 stop:619 length:606 start_codon:yes stop_codon:yes gene_type:complete
MSGIVSDNQGRSSGLVKSAAASSDFKKLGQVTLSNEATASFDGLFTSDYNKYEMVGNGILPASNGGYYRFRVRASDADLTGSSYSNANARIYHDVNAENWWQARASGGSEDLNSGTTFWEAQGVGNKDSSSYLSSVKFTLFAPLQTTRHVAEFESISEDTTTMSKAYGAGVYHATTVLSGMTIYNSAGNMTGTFTLYGYVK